MRYYAITITDPDSGQVIQGKGLESLNLQSTYTSYVNGQSLPGALNVEFDIPLADFATPNAEAFIRVWGVTIAEIGQANDLRGKNIAVYAGMQKGLPLANPTQNGLILQGFINKAFGNWVGTDMTLDLIVTAGSSPSGVGSQAQPKNIVHTWKKGTPLSGAISSTLSTAFPGFTANVNISPKLILTEDDTGYYQTPTQYAQYIRQLSQKIVGGSYQGVRILLKGKTFSVYDGTSQGSPTQISFLDLVGQPTWIDPLTIQVKTIMRADISVGDYVTLPPTVTTTTSGGAIPSGSSQRANSIFQGTFQVGPVRHVGNFRQPTGDAWASIFDVYSTAA